MGKNLCTESTHDLFKMAELDIIQLNDVINSKKYFCEENKFSPICNLANQAVEKFLKGYIKQNNKTIEKTHDLDHIQKCAEEIDASFSEVREQCLQVYDFHPGMRYNSSTPIEKQDIINIINALKIIYKFPKIKEIREDFIKDPGYTTSSHIIINSFPGDTDA